MSNTNEILPLSYHFHIYYELS